ncbi:MAG: hypothetical protein QNJ03_06210 [Dinoroseobacter sp.]|nr:hypothetical protein [Dinoroseobacter sp.]
MELSFDFVPDRQYFAIRFTAGAYESVPFIRELRFWGVDRVPCPRLSTLASLIALQTHHLTHVTVRDAEINPPVCTALQNHFGVEIHPSTYDVDRRDLTGGEKLVAPSRFAQTGGQQWLAAGAEALTWISIDDLDGPFGGHIRTNLDAFDLTESEKNLIVALCCAGKDVGHIMLADAAPDIAGLLHLIGLELINLTDEG